MPFQFTRRALLHDSPIYIFDEATGNIDAESENDIMGQITRLAETKISVCGKSLE